jgi:hypothetical protein
VYGAVEHYITLLVGHFAVRRVVAYIADAFSMPDHAVLSIGRSGLNACSKVTEFIVDQQLVGLHRLGTLRTCSACALELHAGQQHGWVQLIYIPWIRPARMIRSVIEARCGGKLRILNVIGHMLYIDFLNGLTPSGCTYVLIG